MELKIGILIPFVGTTLGSATVFLMKNKINSKIQKLFLGFAAGVMIAASVWSLIIPSIEMAEETRKIPWITASTGFLFGILFLLGLDNLISCLRLENENRKNKK